MGLTKYLPRLIAFGLILICAGFALILASIALSEAKNGKKQSTDPNDIKHYKEAVMWLNWAVGIGWTLVILIILALIAGFILGGEIVAAVSASAAEVLGGAAEVEALLASAGEIKLAAKKVLDASNALNKVKAKEKTGFLYFDYIFGGWFMKIIFFLLLLLLLGFGILLGSAASEIGKTSTRLGFQQAIWATILTVAPLGIFVLWGIIDVIVQHTVYPKQEREAKKKLIESEKELNKELGETHQVGKSELSEQVTNLAKEKALELLNDPKKRAEFQKKAGDAASVISKLLS